VYDRPRERREFVADDPARSADEEADVGARPAVARSASSSNGRPRRLQRAEHNAASDDPPPVPLRAGRFSSTRYAPADSARSGGGMPRRRAARLLSFGPATGRAEAR
jgi:hypothetical protein